MKFLPKIAAEALYRATKDLRSAEAAAAIKKFVRRAGERSDAGLLPLVLKALPEAIRKVDRKETVVIESAHELADGTLDELLTAAGFDKENSEIVARVNPSVIGGFKIKNENRRIDATVSGNLAQLKAALIK